jgi:hypothetical protein
MKTAWVWVVLGTMGIVSLRAEICTLKGTISQQQIAIGRPSIRFAIGDTGRVETEAYGLNVVSHPAPMGVALDLRVRVGEQRMHPRVLAQRGKTFSVEDKELSLKFKGTLLCPQ